VQLWPVISVVMTPLPRPARRPSERPSAREAASRHAVRYETPPIHCILWHATLYVATPEHGRVGSACGASSLWLTRQHVQHAFCGLSRCPCSPEPSSTLPSPSLINMTFCHGHVVEACPWISARGNSRATCVYLCLTHCDHQTAAISIMTWSGVCTIED
jgi:hypothetical protein